MCTLTNVDEKPLHFSRVINDLTAIPSQRWVSGGTGSPIETNEAVCPVSVETVLFRYYWYQSTIRIAKVSSEGRRAITASSVVRHTPKCIVPISNVFQ